MTHGTWRDRRLRTRPSRGAFVLSGPTHPFARVGQTMRTIEVTSVAPRAWACCNASSADSARRVSLARKVTTNSRKLTGPGRTGRSRPACRGGNWGRVRGRCLNWRLNSRAAGHSGGPAPASNRLRSTSNRRSCGLSSRLRRCLLQLRLNRLVRIGATTREGFWAAPFRPWGRW
jgi:hypothetical protein